jgi:predicted O-methyltransferase YrrM
MTVSFNTWIRNWKNIISWSYIKDRLDINFISSVIRQTRFEEKHPMYPWITVDMINILENLLKKSDVGFEFGSGNSTIWLARRTKQVTSVEHNKEWYGKVNGNLKMCNLVKNVNLIFVENINDVNWTGKKDYIKPILGVKNNSLDYCFVDGIFRDECILQAMDKLKTGGILIVDNVDNYFPRNKISVSVRYKRDNQSKTVSKIKMRRIYKILEKWRCIWTTCGSQDTALWIKP